MKRYTIRADERKFRYNIGSRLFFEGFPDFHPKDVDELELEEDPRIYKNVLQFRKKDGTRCFFKWRKMSADDFVDYTLRSSVPMEIGKFLNPEFCNDIGFTIEHLKKLKPVAERLDVKHQYEKIIFDAYIQHGDFILTDEDRIRAYESYKAARL